MCQATALVFLAPFLVFSFLPRTQVGARVSLVNETPGPDLNTRRGHSRAAARVLTTLARRPRGHDFFFTVNRRRADVCTLHISVLGIQCRYNYAAAAGVRATDIFDEIAENVPARLVLRLDADVTDWNHGASKYLGLSCQLLSDPYFAKSIRFTTGTVHDYLIRAVAYGNLSRSTLCKAVFNGWPFNPNKTIGDLIDLDQTTPMKRFHDLWELFDENDQTIDCQTNMFHLEFVRGYPTGMDIPEFVEDEEEEVVDPEPEPEVDVPMDVSEEEEEEEQPAPLLTVAAVDSELTVSSENLWLANYDSKKDDKVHQKLLQSEFYFEAFNPNNHTTVRVQDNHIFFMIKYDRERPVAEDEAIPMSTDKVDHHAPCRLVYIEAANHEDAVKKALFLWSAQHIGKRKADIKRKRVLNAIMYARNEPFDATVMKQVADDINDKKKLKCKYAQALLDESRE